MTITLITRICYVFILALPLVLVLGGFAQSDKDQYEYIDISNPFLRKIPLAIPLFKNETGTAEEKPFVNIIRRFACLQPGIYRLF